MSIKALFKEGFRIYREKFKTVVGLLLMIYLPVSLLTVFSDYRLNNLEEITSLTQQLEGLDEASVEAEEIMALLNGAVTRSYVYIGVMVFIGLLTSVFLMSLIRLAADSYNGCDLSKKKDGEALIIDYATVEDKPDYSVRDKEPRDAQDYFADSVKLLPRYALAMLLSGVFIICGLFFFVFPGIVAALISCFVVYAIVLTPFKGRTAFVFAGTVLSRKPVLMLLYALNFAASLVLSSVFGSFLSLFDIGNIYVTLGATVLLTCVIELIMSFFEIVITVAFYYSIKKTPVLVEIIEAGEKHEAEIAAAKNRE